MSDFPNPLREEFDFFGHLSEKQLKAREDELQKEQEHLERKKQEIGEYLAQTYDILYYDIQFTSGWGMARGKSVRWNRFQINIPEQKHFHDSEQERKVLPELFVLEEKIARKFSVQVEISSDTYPAMVMTLPVVDDDNTLEAA